MADMNSDAFDRSAWAQHRVAPTAQERRIPDGEFGAGFVLMPRGATACVVGFDPGGDKPKIEFPFDARCNESRPADRPLSTGGEMDPTERDPCGDAPGCDSDADEEEDNLNFDQGEVGEQD